MDLNRVHGWKSYATALLMVLIALYVQWFGGSPDELASAWDASQRIAQKPGALDGVNPLTLGLGGVGLASLRHAIKG